MIWTLNNIWRISVMDSSSFVGRLAGWEIHGFTTMQDLDVPGILRESRSRWLQSNEIHAMLSNFTYFSINVKPVNFPKGGTIVFFDRKKLRNFRKDGHNWKKKKDGKTVKEAHEHLKVGTEERVHVYYAHGEENPKFVRRCYWLLDKSLEHIVLVHYRETQEISPFIPANPGLSSNLSDTSASQLLSRGCNLQPYHSYHSALKNCTVPGDSINVSDHERKLQEINTLEWDELLASNPNEKTFPKEIVPYTQQCNQNAAYNLENNGSTFLPRMFPVDMLPLGNSIDLQGPKEGMVFPLIHDQIELKVRNQNQSLVKTSAAGYSSYETVISGLQNQGNFGRLMNEILIDSPGSVGDRSVETSVAISNGSFLSSGATNFGVSVLKEIFSITDISPTWASSTENTKILVVGFFHQECQHLAKTKVFCVCGDLCVPAEIIQVGVFRCLFPPHSPRLVNFYLSIDGRTPISQVLTFEFCSPALVKLEDGDHQPLWNMFQIQVRFSNLLFSSSKSIDILSSKVSHNAIKEAIEFAVKYSDVADSWAYFTNVIEKGDIAFERAKNSLFELTMKSKLKEWLLERIIDGSKTSERDAQGQGVLHLCAILDYKWAVHPFASSGLSLDFRDKFGWTALHWAAYFGREKMVAALLSAGAKANLVTDPTSENHGGCTASDIAYKQGFEGLAAYLSEKGLVQQFEDMKLAGNTDGSLETPSYDNASNINENEDESYLKETLTAYRTVADAAARIQMAFRQHSLKQQTKFVEASKQEDEARHILAAMKIQHAFRNYETRKKMAAAARIQYRFRTWKHRKKFLNLRRQAIKIQALFRGFQVCRQYRKLVWSVGVLEKVVLRWRMKREGLRGLKVEIIEPVTDHELDGDTAEEDFYQASRKQAEERVDKAVVCVQAMFQSRQAQQEYRRMRIAHRQAELEYEESSKH